MTAVAERESFGRALLFACDAKSYGSGDDQLQAAMQEGLTNVLDVAALRAGLIRSEWDTNSTGDGELALLPATESEPRVVDDFVRELRAALARHNRHLRHETQLRLRVAIHYGVAYPAANGYAGQGIVAVSRLLDCAPLREALDRSGANLAVILSSRVYEETVLQGHTSQEPGHFRKVTVRQKEFSQNAWIWVPVGVHGTVHDLSLSGKPPTDVASEPQVPTDGTAAKAPAQARDERPAEGAASSGAVNNDIGTVTAKYVTFGISHYQGSRSVEDND
jgi:hypothetical protein